MKLKFKLMTIFAILGVATTAYAAWHFANPAQGEVTIPIDIETHQSIGTIELDYIGEYNLDQDPQPLVFTARYLEGISGVSVEEALLTYEVVLNEALNELIDFGPLAHGTWANDIETSITPTWKSNKNPTNIFEYNAIKDNLASYQMTVILKAEVINENTPRPTSLQFVFGDGVTDGIELEIGDTIEIRVAVFDQDGNIINYLHPTANLISGASANYENGLLTAVSPETDGTIIFSLPGLEDLGFNFTIKSNLSEFSVTFVYDNGQENSTTPVIENNKLIEPSVPVREGFAFNGWFNGSELYDFNTPVTSDLELRATWLDGDFFAYTFQADGTYKMVGYTQKGNVEVTHLYIPSTYQDIDITIIGSNVFAGVANVTSIRLPNSITTIDTGAFVSMPHLVSVNMPDSLVSIGQNAFAACISLESIVMGDNVTTIGSNGFHGCTSLSELVLSESLVSIGQSAFQNCTSLVTFTIPNSVTQIDAFAFAGCTSLEKLEIPSNVSALNSHVFNGCTSLSEVILHEGLLSIWPQAFLNCTSLKEITLPSTITYVGQVAFEGCTSLEFIYNYSSVGLQLDYNYFSPTIEVRL